MPRIEDRDFYAPWPKFGTKLSQQWGEIRANQESLRPLVKATDTDGQGDAILDSKLRAIKFGEENFQNKTRIDWDKRTQELHFQCNTNTEDNPVWQSFFYLDCTENKTYFLESTAGPGVITNGENVGTGDAGVFKQRSEDKLQFKTLEGGVGISVVEGTDEITITNTGGGGGGGAITVKDTTGADLFSTNVITFHRNDFYITPDSNGDPVINALATGGGGGGGTLTQITITDGVETLSSSEGKFTVSGADFYLTQDTDGNPQINAITDKLDIKEIGGPKTVEEVDILGFNRADFYITETSSGDPVVNLNEPFLGDSSIKTGARTASFSGVEWEFTHNFASDIVLWDIIDDAGESVIPEKADFSNQNVAYFYFLESVTGQAILSTGRVTGEISVAHTDNTQNYSGINKLSVNVDSFYLTQGTSAEEAILNFRGSTGGGGGLSTVNISTSNNSEDQFQTDTVIFNRKSFYLSSSPTTNSPIVNFLPELDEKSITLRGPTRTETITWFIPSKNISVKKMIAFLRADDSGFYPWVDWTVRYGGCPPARGSGTEVITGGTRTGFYPGHPLLVNECDVITSFDNPDIGANNFVWFETKDLGEGTVEEEIHVTMHYSPEEV